MYLYVKYAGQLKTVESGTFPSVVCIEYDVEVLVL